MFKLIMQVIAISFANIFLIALKSGLKSSFSLFIFWLITLTGLLTWDFIFFWFFFVFFALLEIGDMFGIGLNLRFQRAMNSNPQYATSFFSGYGFINATGEGKQFYIPAHYNNGEKIEKAYFRIPMFPDSSLIDVIKRDFIKTVKKLRYKKTTLNETKAKEVPLYSKQTGIQIIKDTFCCGIKYDIKDIEHKLKELGYYDLELSNSHIRIGDSEYEGFYFNGCTWSFTSNGLLYSCSLVSAFKEKDKAMTMAMELKQYLSQKYNFFEAGVGEIYRYDYRGNGFGIIIKVGCESAENIKSIYFVQLSYVNYSF